MDAGAGFNALAAAGAQAGLDKIQRKRNAEDEERRQKASDLIATRNGILTKLPTLLGANGEKTPEYDQAYQSLTQAQQDLGQLYHPDKAPGALAKDWAYLLEKMHGITSPKDKTPSTTTPPAAMTVNAPVAPLQSPDLPGIDPVVGKRVPSLEGSDPVKGTTGPGMAPAASMTLPAGPTVKKMTWEQGQVQKLKDAAMQKAQKQADVLAAGAGLSPRQQATVDSSVPWVKLDSDMAEWDKRNQGAAKDDRDAAYSQFYDKYIGTGGQIGNWERIEGTIDGQPYALSYDKKRGVYKAPDGTISSSMPENFKPTPKGTGATAEELKEYAEDTDPKKGPFPQWLASKRAQGTAAVKPKNKDDRYIEINQKKALGQTVTPDDQAFLGAYDLWEKKTKIDPGVARAAAFGAMRYIPVVSQTDPENVIMMRAGDAAKAGVNTPASIGFKTDQAITRYMTSGAGGTNINYFNTATDHLRLLAEAGKALNNGDTQMFNRVANQFATATGDPAPSNFETVKSAVAGELSKTFKGTGATDSEIAEINQTINQAQSPQQIQGAIDYYTRLMGSKLQALKTQYESAKQGKPNFPGATPPSSGGSKGSRSLAAAMALPINKGKSAEEVQKHLEDLGYKVTKP